jgi:hypothetical protein
MAYIINRRRGLGDIFTPSMIGVQRPTSPTLNPVLKPMSPRPVFVPRPAVEAPPRGVILGVPRPAPSSLLRPISSTVMPGTIFRRPPMIPGLLPSIVRSVTSLPAGGTIAPATTTALVPRIPQVSSSAGGGYGGGGGGATARSGGGGGGGGEDSGGGEQEFDEFDVPEGSPTSSEFDAGKPGGEVAKAAAVVKKPFPTKTVAIGAAIALGIYFMTKGR